MTSTHTDRLVAESMSSAISDAVVGVLKDYTGWEPTKTTTHINEDLITVILNDTLTIEERGIVRNGNVDLVRVTREAFTRAMRPDLITAVEQLSGRSVIAFLSDSHIDPDITIESFVLAAQAGGHPAEKSGSDLPQL